jgi:hypothetical protein
MRPIPTQRKEARTLQFSAAKGQKNSQLRRREILDLSFFPQLSASRTLSRRQNLIFSLTTNSVLRCAAAIRLFAQPPAALLPVTSQARQRT